MQQISVTIIILNYNTKDLTESCIDYILKNTKLISYEIIVIDNGSTDESKKMLIKLRNKNKIILINNEENLGFAKGNNQGISKARGKYILLLNSDTIIDSNVINKTFAWMEEHPKVGICTCALKNKDGSIQGTGGYFPNLIRVFSWMIIQDIPLVDRFIKPFHPMKEKSFKRGTEFYKKQKQVDWVTGAYLMVRKKVIDQIGMIDEEYFMYTEETDFCYRAKKMGWQVWYLPKWSIVHLGGASGTKENAVLSEYKGVKLFYKKHYPLWQYPILRLLLKVGALGRMLLFGTLEGSGSFKIYAKAFYSA